LDCATFVAANRDDKPATHKLVYGNVYTQLLEYIVSADLIFIF
jgi:hypothetical protein